jgi:DNA repair protein RadC
VNSQQNPAAPSLARKPYPLIYRALRKHVDHAPASSVRESGTGADREKEILRFCRRLGAVPKTWPDAQARQALAPLLGCMADGTGDDENAVWSALADFCAEDGPAAVCRDVPLCAGCPIKEHCEHPTRRPTIKDMPEAERPRERLLQGGEDKLSDSELLALIIGGGSEEHTAVDLARVLLSRFDSFRRLARCTVGEMTRVRGIGPAKAARIKAALGIARRYASEKLPVGTIVTGSASLFGYMREKLAGLRRERFYTVMLDTKHRILREEMVAVGSLNESVVHPREVFRAAIAESAAAVIFVHNHPSGNPEPSIQDRRLTTRLCQAGELVGIRVLDHMVIGADTYFSFAEQGLLDAHHG